MTSDVFFFPCTLDDPPDYLRRGVRELILKTGFTSRIEPKDYVALKIHFGERGNRGHVAPDLVQPIVEVVKRRGARPFLTDTNTLYTGQRANAVDHLSLAHAHGFTPERTGAPVIIADGLLGETEVEVPVDGRHIRSASLARDIVAAQGLVSINHFTGHLATGFGAAIKNLGMGCATRKGKMVQHSVMKPQIRRDACTACGVCVASCPEEAIDMVEGAAVIRSAGCIGCGECLAVCRFGAVKFDWNEEADKLQEKVVEFTRALLETKGKKAVHITFLTHITADCDCLSTSEKPIMKDVGIIASNDLVAIEQAALDLVEKAAGEPITTLSGRRGFPVVQTDYAETMGLGSREYRIVEIQIKKEMA